MSSEEEEEISDYLSDVEVVDISDEINEFVKTQMPPIKDLSEYYSFEGILSLTIVPFTQGLFHGLGEGIARVLVGDFVGLPPYYALGGRFGYEPERRKSAFFSKS